MSDRQPDLSIVLPCRDQEDHIARVLRMHQQALDRWGRPYELIAVPNGCTDRTPEIVTLIAEQDERRTRSVVLSRGGWGLAVRAGLAASRGSILCYANSARTEPGQVLALLDRFLSAGTSLAKVRRASRGSLLRSLGSSLYNLEARLLFGLGVADVNGTPKILSRQLYEKLHLSSEGDLLDLELLVQATRLGAAVVELPVSGFRRHGGRSRTGLRSAWRMYRGALELRFRADLGQERVGQKARRRSGT